MMVVTYKLWCEDNNNIALCGTWDMLVATMGYMEGAYSLFHSYLFGADMLPPNRCEC